MLRAIAVGYVSTISGRQSLAAGAISRPSVSSSSSVVVDDVAILDDLEHGLGFVVDDHVHGLRECRVKVYIDAQITLLHQVEAAAVARVRC